MGAHSSQHLLHLVPDADQEELECLRPVCRSLVQIGAVVEECLCLESCVDEVRGTYWENSTIIPNDANDESLRLVPLGLALLYPISRQSPALSAQLCKRDDRYWLIFRAARQIQAGEQITTSYPDAWGFLQSLDEAEDWRSFGRFSICGHSNRLLAHIRARTASFHPLDPVCRMHRLKLCTSKVHGVGVYARRFFAARDTVDIVPTLPLTGMDEDFVNSYAFGHEIWFTPHAQYVDLRCLCLGPAMLYNHSDTPNVNWACLPLGPVIYQVWFATRDIQEGDELRYYYGPDYFKETGEDIQE